MPFRDDDSSKLVAFEPKPWHVVEDREHDSTSADDKDSDGDEEPDPLVHENRVDAGHEVDEDGEDCGSDCVLNGNRSEGEFDLHIGPQVVVQEVDLLLGIEDLLPVDEPLLLFFEELGGLLVAF